MSYIVKHLDEASQILQELDFDSIERKWDDLLSEPTFSNASSIFKEMDFVTGFPAVAYRRSPVIAPMKFGLIDQDTISTLRRHLLKEIVHTSGTK